METIKKINNVSVALKANVYFEGKVVSYTMELKDGSKKTAGIIYPGSFTFNTGAPERMDIISGTCKVMVNGQKEFKTYSEGTFFEVPGKSSFAISVENGLCQYLCSYLK